jgi:HlyD family secretion protein
MKNSLFNLLGGLSRYDYRVILLTCGLMGSGVFISGCANFLTKEADAQPPAQREAQPPSVEVTTAKIQPLTQGVSYVGNTEAIREVSLRSQIEGRLLRLNADVGDRITRGQLIAQLDDILIQTAISEADAQLAALQSEVIRSQNEVKNAQVQVKQSEVELKQAQADAKRLKDLAQAGALPLQQAEVAQTNAQVAYQRLLASQEQVKIREESVIAAQQRVKAQNSSLAQIKERRSYTLLTAPITGIVVAKSTEPGNLVQPGGEIITVGDFSQVKVVVPLSELKLQEITLGQRVNVTLDAFGDQIFEGKISQISPAANAQTRQIPIEVTIPNPEGKIGSGLLARVSLDEDRQSIVIPETALQGENKDTIFVIKSQGDDTIVESRNVQLGDRSDNLIEILAGLNQGERFVWRSSGPLTDGEIVRLSVLSN